MRLVNEQKFQFISSAFSHHFITLIAYFVISFLFFPPSLFSSYLSFFFFIRRLRNHFLDRQRREKFGKFICLGIFLLIHSVYFHSYPTLSLFYYLSSHVLFVLVVNISFSYPLPCKKYLQKRAMMKK